MTKTSEADRQRDEIIKRMLDQKPKDQKQLKEELRTERGHWAPKPGRPKQEGRGPKPAPKSK